MRITDDKNKINKSIKSHLKKKEKCTNKSIKTLSKKYV